MGRKTDMTTTRGMTDHDGSSMYVAHQDKGTAQRSVSESISSVKCFNHT